MQWELAWGDTKGKQGCAQGKQAGRQATEARGVVHGGGSGKAGVAACGCRPHHRHSTLPREGQWAAAAAVRALVECFPMAVRATGRRYTTATSDSAGLGKDTPVGHSRRRGLGEGRSAISVRGSGECLQAARRAVAGGVVGGSTPEGNATPLTRLLDPRAALPASRACRHKHSVNEQHPSVPGQVPPPPSNTQ